MPSILQDQKIYGVVYIVTNTMNGKQYVGQTTQPVAKRWAYHVRNATIGRRHECHALWSAIRKYGPSVFSVKAVIACDNQEELNRMEVMAIAAGNTLSPVGYNLRMGGSNGRHGVETRTRMKGKIRSPEHCANLRNALKDKPLSIEHRAKLSAAHKGKPWSPAKIESMKNRSLSLESRAKISAALVGRSRPLETRAKISATKMGHSVSPETRAKISATLKKRKT